MDTKRQKGKQRDQPFEEASFSSTERPSQRPLGVRLARWLARWGSDLLLTWGAGCVSAGVGWIYPPAGLIVAGALMIVGGVLWARGKGGDGP